MPEPHFPEINRRQFLRYFLRGSAASAMLAAGVYTWDFGSEPRHLRLERVRIPIAGLPAPFDGYRIVQITDIHFGPAIAYRTVLRSIEIARDLAPDCIVLTGDFITYYVDDLLLKPALRGLAAPDGVWAVMGNHDYWADVEGVRRVLAEVGIPELRNSHVPIRRHGGTLWLAGVDDIWEQRHDLSAALDGIPEDAITILLAHEPDYADEVAPTGRVALQLSGHSHGGQVRIPVLDIPVLSEFVHLARKYPHGLYRIGGMWLYTSAGVGRGPVPRVYASPEVNEITLIRA